ncbi:ECF RNA polymerase sigma factor SigW [Clostridium acetireducens DSM 10703]|uniref:ECF RNA polymerase sigma factor SigW n=1 Tax=Clostridium acetireducens DSM 10703 TaxID=1121290 RepID=A0A1E8F007_9CLOT|nr:sigma-70 family RNA polymerase sigma factor [Clostridium acetireducens]OFI06768.1 ECF RNA polymerase sigma factor SigW [Clostridium acetireducens DSM 10703]
MRSLKISKENFIDFMLKRDEGALEFAVDLYGDLVYRVVYSSLSKGFQVNSIEECVNDVFLAIWDNIDSYDKVKGNFKSWIIAISKYKAIDYIRKYSKEEHLEFLENIILEDKCNVEKLVIAKEDKERVLKMLDELKDIDKEIFVDRYLLGEEISKIAEKLNVDRSVIDNRLSRGRKFLKKKFLSLKEDII